MAASNLIERVKAVFKDIDTSTRKASEETGLRCPTGCRRCCENPNVEASVLEMLPLAEEVIAAGRYEDVLESVANSTNQYCVFLKGKETHPHWGCSAYENRPSVCRLFGFAGVRNKVNRNEFAFCRVHKETQPAQVEAVKNATVLNRVRVPLFSEFATRLEEIEPNLGSARYPINEALVLALQRLAYENSLR